MKQTNISVYAKTHDISNKVCDILNSKFLTNARVRKSKRPVILNEIGYYFFIWFMAVLTLLVMWGMACLIFAM